MPHFLRLKEQKRNRTAPAHPTPRQLKRSDGTLEDTDFDMSTDSNGFILTGADTDPTKPSIFFVGGSLVESSFAHPQDRFVSQVARSVDWNVYNTGYSGTTLLQSCLMIMGKLAALAKKGDVVLIFASQSDANAARYQGGYWTNNSTYSPLRPPLPEAPAMEFSTDDTRGLLDTIQVFLEGRGIHMAFATAPYRRVDWATDKWVRGNYSSQETFDEARKIREELNDAVFSHSDWSTAPFLDLAGILDGAPALFYDEQHFNKSGHDKAAGIIVDFLLENFINPPAEDGDDL